MKIINTDKKNLVKVKDTKPGDLLKWADQYWLRVNDLLGYCGPDKTLLWVVKISEDPAHIIYFRPDNTEVELVKGVLHIERETT